MADEEGYTTGAAAGGDDDWAEQIDVTGLEDGPTTSFVGGFSACKTIDEALQGLVNYNDRIVVLGRSHKGDMRIDTVKFDGVNIVAGSPDGATFDGKLVLGYTSLEDLAGQTLKRPSAATDGEGEDGKAAGGGAPGEDGEDGSPAAPPPAEEEEGEEGAAPKEPRRPSVFTLKNITFLQGCVAEGLSKGDILDCTFGIATGEVIVDHCLVTQALSSVEFMRCKVFGSKRSGVYNFPLSRVKLTDCTVRGTTRPAAPSSASEKRPRRGYVPPPPPPPSAPAKTECDVGIYNDDAAVTISNCTVALCDVGVLFNDSCKGCAVELTRASEIATVGFLIGAGSAPRLSKCQAALCGRECLVALEESHPSVRDCAFVGNARLKKGCIATGMTDNVLGLNGTVTVEDTRFLSKGFRSVPTDPTIVKAKKVVADE